MAAKDCAAFCAGAAELLEMSERGEGSAVAKPTPEEMARKLGMPGAPSRATPQRTRNESEGEKPRKRGAYFKATPKKDALLTISTTMEAKKYIDERCMRGAKEPKPADYRDRRAAYGGC